MEYLKRKDRQETVLRISKIQEYKREKIMDKIMEDDMRSQSLRHQKDGLLQARLEMKK